MTPSDRSRSRSRRRSRSRSRGRSAGFTLVEVLVALVVMALLATMAFQALDGVLRARDHSRDSIDRTARLSTVLAQWEQDLQAVHDTEVVPAIAFDGQTLRLTRRVAGGVALVAWSVRGGVWQRWTAPPFVRTGDLQEAWLRSQQFQGVEPGHLTLTEGVGSWQIYFSRDGQWSNAQSSGNLVATFGTAVPPAAPEAAPSAPAPGPSTPPGPDAAASAPGAAAPLPVATLREAVPGGVRLLITLGGATLVRDIALGPAA